MDRLSSEGAEVILSVVSLTVPRPLQAASLVCLKMLLFPYVYMPVHISNKWQKWHLLKTRHIMIIVWSDSRLPFISWGSLVWCQWFTPHPLKTFEEWVSQVLQERTMLSLNGRRSIGRDQLRLSCPKIRCVNSFWWFWGTIGPASICERSCTKFKMADWLHFPDFRFDSHTSHTKSLNSTMWTMWN